MAVIDIREVWNNRGGKIDERGKRDYRRIWRLTTDNPLDGPYTVRSSVPVVEFQQYVDSNGNADPYYAYANAIDVVNDDEDPQKWTATVNYSSRTDQPQLGTNDPTQRVAEVSWDYEQFQRPIEIDSVNNAIVNSVGERFDPPIEIDDSRLVLTVKRIEPSYNPNALMAYKDAINADVFLGFPIGTVKARAPVAERHFEQGTYYFLVTYQFHIKPEGWTLFVLDQGFRAFDLNGNLFNCVDHYGQPVSAPMLLNGEGLLLNGVGSPANLTTLSGAIDNQVQQITIASANYLPKLAATVGTLGYPILVGGETMNVVGGQGTTTLAVSRANPVPHNAGVPVQMKPYYVDFYPYSSIPFAPLDIT